MKIFDRKQLLLSTVVLLVIGSGFGNRAFSSDIKTGDTKKSDATKNDGNTKIATVIEKSVAELLAAQAKDGSWSYEGVYRVRGKIPVGYRIGGTAIVCESLLYTTKKSDQKANKAMQKGVQLILNDLKNPLMKMSQQNRYDVRVWGHIFSLDLFCRLTEAKRCGALKTQVAAWIPKLTKILIAEELKGGGWNYASRQRHAAFVTSPAVQALLWAKSLGEKVPSEIFERAAKILAKSRSKDGAFVYSGTTGGRMDRLPGSIARSAVCETTLRLLGKGSAQASQSAIDAFHKYWNELEKRRKKTGTHRPPYGVAPYYFYYGHRYLAQAITMLPKAKQAAERKRYTTALMKTKDADNTWNDRVFAQSRSYGTAMAILSLVDHDIPLPPVFKK